MNTNERDRKAMARLKELTPYMSDKERERLVEEGRSETYKTYQLAWTACEQSERVRALEESLKQKQYLIGQMDAALIEKGVNFDFDNALAAWGDGK